MELTPEASTDGARRLLREGEVSLLGRIPWSSNATHLALLANPRVQAGNHADPLSHTDPRNVAEPRSHAGPRAGSGEMLAVYKPIRGERPLWDFPTGTLAAREAAAFEISEALGWCIVPDTVVRDGPLGVGMVQRFVEHDPAEHYFTLLGDHSDRLLRFAVFDVVVNNADRKGGHVLLGLDGALWGIDHGVTFHPHWKLRTVIWDFASCPIGTAVEADLRALLGRLDDDLARRLAALLTAEEIGAIRQRVEHLLAAGVLPDADPGHHSYPWPLV
ncbi:MAG: SCO1664 family protein [Acidimicrobiia bacterium]|nr:SCO1664 family protein [Acidimicrobiia bacterium]